MSMVECNLTLPYSYNPSHRFHNVPETSAVRFDTSGLSSLHTTANLPISADWPAVSRVFTSISPFSERGRYASLAHTYSSE